jgi:hypothetical protein
VVGVFFKAALHPLTYFVVVCLFDKVHLEHVPEKLKAVKRAPMTAGVPIDRMVLETRRWTVVPIDALIGECTMHDLA